MELDREEFRILSNLIKDSFRVRKNHKPLYIDMGGNLARIASPQHQIIFGRRGSGKSCLLIHHLNSELTKEVQAVYILADEYKRLTYPDILIRLLIEIFEAMPDDRSYFDKLRSKETASSVCVTELRRLLDLAEEAEVTEDRNSSRHRESSLGITGPNTGNASVGGSVSNSQGRTSSFKEHKLEILERHLKDYKNALQATTQTAKISQVVVLVDDFYLMPGEWQPNILDYLHILLRDTNLYLKIATIRHRTKLIKNTPRTIGVELFQDVEEISLDRTLEDLDSTQEYLSQMLASIARKAGIEDIIVKNFNPEALQALTLASGGVPRDFLTIFVNALDASVADGGTRWLTPKYVYKGAGRLVYQTKIKNLNEDAIGDAGGLERVLHDLLVYCLKEKKKTAFLISQEEAQQNPREHDLIQQLMDFKLVHVVEPDTSAASGRPGRYEAYTLDFSLFMEPRRRNIEIVEFWKIDSSRNRTGLREAPIYSLERAGKVFDNALSDVDVDGLLSEVPENTRTLNNSIETSQGELEL